MKSCPSEKHERFEVHTFEFNDQGHPTDAEAQAQTLELIRTAVHSQEGAVVFVFGHGWQHNAHVCDENLCCVRKILNTLAFLEEKHWNKTTPRRRVVGVYLSWRGYESVKWEGYRRFDIFTRDLKSRRVGRGDELRKVLEQIDGFVKHPPAKPTGDHLRLMVMVGHSFGSNLALWPNGQVPEPDPAKPVDILGNLVVLVNPAMPAREFAPWESLSRRGSYHADQVPVLISVTSSADWATKLAFPLSRWMAFPLMLVKARRASTPVGTSFATVGHYRPFVTHALTTENPAKKKNASGRHGLFGQRACRCLYEWDDQKLLEGIVAAREARLRGDAKAAPDFSAEERFGHARLKPVRSVPSVHKNSPVLNIQTDGWVINGHGDIFNPEFVTFLARFVSDLVSSRTPPNPVAP